MTDERPGEVFGCVSCGRDVWCVWCREEIVHMTAQSAPRCDMCARVVDGRRNGAPWDGERCARCAAFTCYRCSDWGRPGWMGYGLCSSCEGAVEAGVDMTAPLSSRDVVSDALMAMAAWVANSPTHRLGDTVIVRVDAAGWERFVEIARAVNETPAAAGPHDER